ncbi:MAG: Gfo/Idh/MocA family oxidoreductase [Pirellulales bacterium]|nr:Gfo/Idh/MocA family oxidoreductase [Pirellulales bacterium]
MKFSRRDLVKASTATAIATLCPQGVFGAAKKKGGVLRIAGVGVGGRGFNDLQELCKHPAYKLTAVADVDTRMFKKMEHRRVNPRGDDSKNCKKFQDYRKMFQVASDEFDAVLVATPDHMHAPIAKLAMEADKHVFLQKPLAQDVKECRMLTELAAKKPHLATQMGIQIHAHGGYKSAARWIQEGLIGTVQEVVSWSAKGWGGPMPDRPGTPPPKELAWDLYVGVAGNREYVPGFYHQSNWRKWLAFGSGTLGDMGCHILDPIFSGLEIKAPFKVQSFGGKPHETTHPLEGHVESWFRGTKYTADPVKLTWYHGGNTCREEVQKRLSERLRLKSPLAISKSPNGSLVIGEKGALHVHHFGYPFVVGHGEEKITVPRELYRSGHPSQHFIQWIDAALGRRESTDTPFSYSGPLTEAVLLGTVVNRWPKEEFEWNHDSCSFAGKSEIVRQANALLRPPYRDGW